MEKLAIKVALSPLTTPRLCAQLAEISDPRLRAEVLRRLAELGAEAILSAGSGAAVQPPAGGILAALTFRPDRIPAPAAAPAPPPFQGPAPPPGAPARREDRPVDPVTMCSQADSFQESISDSIPREPEDQKVLPAGNLDLNAVNSAMSRFFD